MYIRWLGAYRHKHDGFSLYDSLVFEFSRKTDFACEHYTNEKNCDVRAMVGLLVDPKGIFKRYTNDVWSEYEPIKKSDHDKYDEKARIQAGVLSEDDIRDDSRPFRRPRPDTPKDTKYVHNDDGSVKQRLTPTRRPEDAYSTHSECFGHPGYFTGIVIHRGSLDDLQKQKRIDVTRFALERKIPVYHLKDGKLIPERI